jgi:hypothetical protein
LQFTHADATWVFAFLASCEIVRWCIVGGGAYDVGGYALVVDPSAALPEPVANKAVG